MQRNVPLIGSLVTWSYRNFTHVSSDDVPPSSFLLNKIFFHSNPNSPPLHMLSPNFLGWGRLTMHSTVPFQFLEKPPTLCYCPHVQTCSVDSLCMSRPQGDSVYTLPARGLSGSPGVSSQLPDHDLWHHWPARGQRLPSWRGNGCCWGHAALSQVFTHWPTVNHKDNWWQSLLSRLCYKKHLIEIINLKL